MRKTHLALIIAVLGLLAPAIGLGTATPVAAQQQHNPACGSWQNGVWVSNGTCHQTHNPNCGSWQNGTWVSNGTCPNPNGYNNNGNGYNNNGNGYSNYYGTGQMSNGTHSTIRGTITAVSGNMVTVQLSRRTIVINDQSALNRQTSGRVAVGRQIAAHGYWRNGTFYATALL